MNNGRDCEHGQQARSCDRCADAAEIAELRLGVELLAKCAMAAHEALKCRDRFGWSPEADAALELLRATVPPMPFVPSEATHVLARRVNELTLYAAQVEAERDAARSESETAYDVTGQDPEPATDEAVRAKASAEDPGGEDLCKWSFERGWRAAEDTHGITPSAGPNGVVSGPPVPTN